MKILFLTPYLPGPPIFGGQRRIHGLMTQLASSHELSIIALTDGYADHRPSLLEAQNYCRHVIAVPDKLHRKKGRQKRMSQLRSLVSRQSWERIVYRCDAVQDALDQHLAQHEYDIIVCEFVFMAYYRFRFPRARTRLVLDEHNVEYDLLRRTASATRLDRKFFHSVNWRKLKREEVRAWKRFDACTVTSRRDQELVHAEAPRVRTAVVPNGVDIELFRPRELATEPMTLLFFGAINYYPNTDAALFFAKEVMPLLKARYPSLRLRIVGPIGDSPVNDLHGEDIRVVGFVDDVLAEIARATIVVAPLRIGGGTRLKILEAMAMSKVVVATRIGAEGIDVQHDRDILLADTPAEQAREIGRLLDDDALRQRLGQAARETAVARYSWRACAEKLEHFLYELMATTEHTAESGDAGDKGDARDAVSDP
jgi:glycosyltransferase involved in cell wall biosynthesis